jgi:putative transcription factor
MSITISVCRNCSTHGAFLGRVSAVERTPLKPKTKNIVEEEEKEPELVPDYAEFVKSAREKKGLKQEEVAKKVNEPASLIKKIETGKIRPTEKLARKLEVFLGVELFEKE